MFVSSILLSVGSCDRKKPPKSELCLVGTNDSFQCNDPRLNDGQQDYDLVYPDDVVNYVCTNPNDYGILRNYCNQLREDLIKCEDNLDKSRRKR